MILNIYTQPNSSKKRSRFNPNTFFLKSTEIRMGESAYQRTSRFLLTPLMAVLLCFRCLIEDEIAPSHGENQIK
uniref:Uncharacterized protein n=1 Tax=Physcomitrium patens TaxID=3218 RepID=A0A7I4D4Z1_PHYPA